MRRFALTLWVGVICFGLSLKPAQADDVACLRAEDEASHPLEYPIQFESAGLVLRGRLFVPRGKGPHPAVVMLHGGGQQRLNEAPLFFAPMIARCGIAALVYDKRGTGASGGVWEAAHFDDFVADAVAAVTMLGQRSDIRAEQIGLIGFSQGGRLAPVVAVEGPEVAFVVSVSGPFVPLFDTRMYALRRLLRQRGVQGEQLHATMAAWEAHFRQLADASGVAATEDTPALHAASVYIRPPAEQALRTPFYNSIARDYAAPLYHMEAPMLAIYGERDALVPVEESIAVLRGTLDAGGQRAPDVVVYPYADHSLTDWVFKQRIEVEETMLAWIKQHLTLLPAANASSHSAQ